MKVNKCYRSDKAVPSHITSFTLYSGIAIFGTAVFHLYSPLPTPTQQQLCHGTSPSSAGDMTLSAIIIHFILLRPMDQRCLYLPSDSSPGLASLLMRTGLRVWRTIAADDDRGGGSSGRSCTTDPDEHRVHWTRLYLAAADDGLGPAAPGFTTSAALRALVHVQLAGLHGATAAGRDGTATPGALYASPHPLHSTTGVRLTIGYPHPFNTVTRDEGRARGSRASILSARPRPFSASCRSSGDEILFSNDRPKCAEMYAPVHDAASLTAPMFAFPSFHERTNPGVYPE